MTKFHWQDFIPSYFNMTLGEFTFWMLIVGILGLSALIVVVVADKIRRKR